MASSIKVYPNPTSNMLTIDADVPIKKIEVFSILGKKVKELNENFERISLFDMTEGIYLVKIYSDNAYVIKKIIKDS